MVGGEFPHVPIGIVIEQPSIADEEDIPTAQLE